MHNALAKIKGLEKPLTGIQGMTVRTARLPGAGNLLGWAGEDLSGLPDRESHYQFLLTVS